MAGGELTFEMTEKPMAPKFWLLPIVII
jgi:hypothetical protein